MTINDLWPSKTFDILMFFQDYVPKIRQLTSDNNHNFRRK